MSITSEGLHHVRLGAAGCAVVLRADCLSARAALRKDMDYAVGPARRSTRRTRRRSWVFARSRPRHHAVGRLQHAASRTACAPRRTVTINLAICFRIKADPGRAPPRTSRRNFVYKVTPRGSYRSVSTRCEEATPRKVARAPGRGVRAAHRQVRQEDEGAQGRHHLAPPPRHGARVEVLRRAPSRRRAVTSRLPSALPTTCTRTLDSSSTRR